MANMKAIRIHAYGGPEVLVYEDAPRPTPGPGEVVVRVHAASINPIDWKIRAGYLKDHIPYTFPVILGWDLSGVVDSVGAGVTAFKAGEDVFAMADLQRNGAYAEYIAVEAGLLAVKPKSLDHAHAAAVPLAALTAYHGLFEFAGLKQGQRVLVHGAAGGVGSFAVQLAKWKGAHVIGTASGRNQDFVRSLGADETIDYTVGPFEKIVRDVDVVFDTVGGETQARSWQVLRRGGVLASTVGQPSAEKAAEYGVLGKAIQNRPDGGSLAEIAKLLDAGTIKAIVEMQLPLAEARRAHEASQGGHTRGKIVLLTI